MIAAGGEFAVIAKCFSVREDIVPDKTAGGIGQRIHAIDPASGRITAWPAGEGTLHIVRGDAGVRPIMAVGAEDAGAIRVVQQSKLADELVLVRRRALAENTQ